MDNFTHTGSRLASLEVFPPAQSYVYLDAASVGLTHKGAAEAINRWQTQLADDGTVAFDERGSKESRAHSSPTRRRSPA